jgi:hypothetical protein
MIELILGAATLLGGAAAAWYFYDRWSGKTPRPITEGDLANLETRLKALLKTPPPSQHTATSPDTVSVPSSDPLSKQILRLIETRQALISRLANLAHVRGKPITEQQIPARLAEARLPKTFEDAARRVLDFTSDLQRVHPADLQHSQWAVEMAEACMGFIDIAIRNVRDSKVPTNGA